MTDLRKITNLKGISPFNNLLKRLLLSDVTINAKEKQFLLSVAILLLKKFQKNQEYKTSFELAYCIILKYSLLFKDWKPLYDFSVNFGFYPVFDSISKGYPNFSCDLTNEAIAFATQSLFGHNNIVETKEQKKSRLAILEDNSDNLRSYIAPTSFGKSQVIVEHLIKNIETLNRFAVIVPTKSLLMQTYRMIKKANLGIRTLVHDEMYLDDERFIAVFTQERALRLLEKQSNISFDVLYIDEAHKLLDLNSRTVLLTRLIKTNSLRNPDNKILYLSPMISDSENLKISNQNITNPSIMQCKIVFNMKEPEICEYQLNRTCRLYNRFFNEFYDHPTTELDSDEFAYILRNISKKNFIYLYTPKKVQQFAEKLFSRIEVFEHGDLSSIQEVIRNLKAHVHDDFYISKYLEKGIIYLHGKVPDNVKDYLEYKFNSIPEIPYLVANHVILEGINLPIDSLFIVQPTNLNRSALVNLIGRVNRLNMIFTGNMDDLSKLSPKIHFVNNTEFCRSDSNMERKIRQLRTTGFDDDVCNPLLEKFDINQFNEGDATEQRKKQKCETILKNEEIVFSDPQNNAQVLKKNMLKLGLDVIYKMQDLSLFEDLYLRIENARNNSTEVSALKKIQTIFIQNFEDYISDFEILRLRNDAATAYYEYFIDNYLQKSLKEKVSLTTSYLQTQRDNNHYLQYIGSSFGEVNDQGVIFGITHFIDLRRKTNEDLVNISVIKIKMEEDFISFKLNKFFQLMLDYRLITQEEYNLLVYGTNDEFKLDMVKLGLSLNIINKLIEDGQSENIYLDDNKNLRCNEHFVEYKNSVDDFFKFELEKFL